MKVITVIIFYLSVLSANGQAAIMFLGKDIGEANFIAERKNIKLSDTSQLGNGMSYITYTANAYEKPPRVDLGTQYILFFDSTKGGQCTEVQMVPKIQGQWVADTLINRLKKKALKLLMPIRWLI